MSWYLPNCPCPMADLFIPARIAKAGGLWLRYHYPIECCNLHKHVWEHLLQTDVVRAVM